MCESAMVSEAEDRTVKVGENIKVWGFSSKSQGRSRECGLAIESGAPQIRAEKKVRDRFQAW